MTPRIDVTEANGVQIVRFLDRRLFDEPLIREAADQLLEVLPRDGRPIRLILDFSQVELVSSSLLGKLILVQRRVDASGGRLRLCELNNPVLSVFRSSNLDRLFALDRDRREALEAFQ